jgi:adenosylmethionine-8-amino-7-oxononanoate aminotransferase
MWEAGVYCRADDRGNAVVQFAPPLICGQAEFDQIESAMRSVLTDAWSQL